MNVGIYLYDKAEVLDFSGPFEVFTTASRVCQNDTPFNVFLIGESGGTIAARAGYKVMPDYGFHNHPQIDVFIVVGGDHTEEIHKPKVISWIHQQAQQASLVASVWHGGIFTRKSGGISRATSDYPLGRYCRFKDAISNVGCGGRCTLGRCG